MRINVVLVGGWIASFVVFLAVAARLGGGEAYFVDREVLLWFRRAAEPGELYGPPWLQGAVRDVTALGSSMVLNLVIIAVLGILLILRKLRLAVAVLLSLYGGLIFGALLKQFFGRVRPAIVPHLAEVADPSFPSGHALNSAVVYLTLAALLAQASPQRSVKIYAAAVAIALTLLVGVTRVILGVHYPTDVMAGWAAGSAWALACLLVIRAIR